MKRLGLALLLLTGCAITPVVPSVPFRAGATFGGWKGKVTETFGSNSGEAEIQPAVAGSLHLGAYGGPVYVAWTPTYFGVGKLFNDGGGGSGYASYTAWLSVELGANLPRSNNRLPLEPFIGYEYGTLNFVNGTKSSFAGSALKGGLSFFLSASEKHAIGVRAEYRRHSFTLQNSSVSIPGLEIDSSTWFLGLVFSVSGS
jgi:hypothetical protein